MLKEELVEMEEEDVTLEDPQYEAYPVSLER